MITSEIFQKYTFLILGFGVTGKAVANALSESKAQFYVYDDNQKDIEFPKIDSLANVNWSEIDYIVASPGIDVSTHEISKYNVQNKIISDLDLLYLANPSATYVGITGTNGKSTVTSLIHHALSKQGYKAQIGGNIGMPAMSLKNGSNNIYVLELSSFQIDLNKFLRLDYAIMLNIAPDHLDRYKTFEAYKQSKLKIFSDLKQEGIGLINSNINAQPNCKLVKFDGEGLELNLNATKAVYHLITGANLTNEELEDFKGLPHRMENFYSVKNINFVNDSKGTNTHATAMALKNFQNIYWIAGNINKDDEIEKLIEFAPHIKKAYFIGRDEQKFAKAFEGVVEYNLSQTLENALLNIKKDIALDNSAKTVLLSPAGASFDQWNNFMHRGDDFKQLAQKIFKEA